MSEVQGVNSVDTAVSVLESVTALGGKRPRFGYRQTQRVFEKPVA